MASISPTQSNVQAALAAFLADVLPVASPNKLGVFTATISDMTLKVAAMIAGSIAVGSSISGAAPGTIITGQLSGTHGGVGTYSVSILQTVGNATTMSTGVTIRAGQQNRAAEPANPFFAIITPLRFERLTTNVDDFQDVKFTGSIDRTGLMTVTGVDHGTILLGGTVFGVGVAQNTKIVAFDSGIGAEGTYQVSIPQVIASETLSAGWASLKQQARLVAQIDFHSSDTTAGDFAQIVSTTLRDEYGVDFFASLEAPLNGVVPLYADDPAQRPFYNAEEQYEWRWGLDCHLEIDQTVIVPLQFADSAVVTLVDVLVAYGG